MDPTRSNGEAKGADFRATATERLARVERAWSAVRQGGNGSERLEEELLADLVALQNEARAAGLSDVTLLARKIEAIVHVARAQKYRVGVDAEILVTMGIQFVGMLTRRKAGAAMGGIDLVGFIKQLDDVLRQEGARVAPAAGAGGQPARARERDARVPREPERAPERGREPERAREREDAGPAATPVRSEPAAALRRLASATTQLYLEYLRASGAARGRLYELWFTIVRDVPRLGVAALAPRAALPVHTFGASRGGVRFAVPAEWALAVSASGAAAALEPVELLGLADEADASLAPSVRTLRFARDGSEVVLLGGPPTQATATRVAPTGAHEPLEVVDVDGVDVLLLRPDVLARSATEARRALGRR